ncbi:hypothetical protein SEA_EHYELIMAYOE_128 [Streptomyces phage EhyElimayoE]|nr:hypothetical protein SEA_EHYELIMAYOE_128 [Streptomyces phage EhyElimayoE]
MTAEALEVRLTCLTEDAAEDVVRRCDEVPKERLGETHSARREGNIVVISYTNKLWPFDIADMASDLGAADDAEVAKVIACL